MERFPLTVLGSGIFKKTVISLLMSSFGLLCQEEEGESGEKEISLLIFLWFVMIVMPCDLR